MTFNLRNSSSAADRNKAPILEVMAPIIPHGGRVLELGSGTGLHGDFFSREIEGVIWQMSEHPDRVQVLNALPFSASLPAAIALDIAAPPWPVADASLDVVFLANVLHMLPEDAIPGFFRESRRVLKPGGSLSCYGPFNERGTWTGPGNEAFDAKLRSDNPLFGLRDIGDLADWATAAGLSKRSVARMPADNRLLIWDSPDGIGD